MTVAESNVYLKNMTKGAWTKNDLRDLKRLFPGRSTEEVAQLLHRPLQAVKKKASRLGLRKSKKRMKALGK
jgi:hypothetical protein